MKIIIGITGASGSIYAARLIKALHDMQQEIHLVITKSGQQVMRYEYPQAEDIISSCVTKIYDIEDIGAAIASGSFLTDAMIVVPCSMKTAAAIANGLAGDLLTRAADVTIKEGRPLIVVPRETPMSAIHLENLLKLARLGVRVLPACPAFYHRPDSLDGIADMMAGKICDTLHLKHNLFTRWQGDSKEE